MCPVCATGHERASNAQSGHGARLDLPPGHSSGVRASCQEIAPRSPWNRRQGLCRARHQGHGSRRILRHGPLHGRGAAVLLAAVALVTSSCTDDGGSDADDEETTSPSTPPPAEASTFDEIDCWWDDPPDTPAEVTITCGTVEVPSVPGDPDSEPVTLAVAACTTPTRPPTSLRSSSSTAARVAAPSTPHPIASSCCPASPSATSSCGTSAAPAARSPASTAPRRRRPSSTPCRAPTRGRTSWPPNRQAVQACRERLTDSGHRSRRVRHLGLGGRSGGAARDLRPRAVERVGWFLRHAPRPGLRPGAPRSRPVPPDRLGVPTRGRRRRTSPGAHGLGVAAAVRCVRRRPGCAAAYGDLEDLLATAVDDLDRRPEELTRSVVVGGETQDRSFAITGSDLRAGVFVAMYRSDLIPLLPSIISALAEGDRSIIPAFIDFGIPSLVEPVGRRLLLGRVRRLRPAGRWSRGAGRAGGRRRGRARRARLRPGVLPGLGGRAPAGVVQRAGGRRRPDARVRREPRPDHAVHRLEGAGRGHARRPVRRGAHRRAHRRGVRRLHQQARADFWTDPSADLPACVDELAARPFAVS